MPEMTRLPAELHAWFSGQTPADRVPDCAMPDVMRLEQLRDHWLRYAAAHPGARMPDCAFLRGVVAGRG